MYMQNLVISPEDLAEYYSHKTQDLFWKLTLELLSWTK